jgi:O-antigen ligase
MRNIGLYHDQAALKYFVFQTITGIILYWCYFEKQSKLILFSLATYFFLCLPVLLKLYVKSGNIVLAIWILGFCMFKRNYFLLASGAVIIGVVFVVFQEQILVDVSSVYRQELGYFEGKVELEQTFAGRWHGWKSTIEKWFSADLIEQMFGFGRYGDSYGAHNDFLFALARSGLVGLTAYILLLIAAGVSVLLSLCKDGSILSFMALMLFIMWMVETIGLVPSAYPSFQWFAWGFVGLSLRISKNKNVHQPSAYSIAFPRLSTKS